MADNVTFQATVATPPSGTVVSSEEVTTLNGVVVAAQQVQRIAVTIVTANGVAIDLPGEASNGLDVDVTRVIPGVTATALGKAEDAIHSSGDTGVMALGVRQDADSPFGADGDYAPFQFDDNGFLKVNIKAGAGSGGTAMTDDAAFTPAVTSFTPVGAFADEVAPDSVNEGDGGVLRMSLNRNLYTQIRDGQGNERSAYVTASNELVVIDSNSSAIEGNTANVSDATRADDAAFSPGTTRVLMSGFFFDDVAPDSVDEGDAGAARMSANRNIYMQIRDAAGNERGANVTASNELNVLETNSADISNLLGNLDSYFSGVTLLDDGGFTAGGNKVMMSGFFFDDVAPDSVDEGDAGAARMSANRNIYMQIRDAAGNERGANVNASNQLTVIDANSASALTALQLLDDAIKTDDNAFTPATDKLSMAGFFADETATDSVDEGDAGAARITLDRKQIVTPYAHAAAGGITPYKLISAATTNATNVKASAGKLFGIQVYNLNASPRYLKLYNLSGAPTVGTDTPVKVIMIPGNTAGAGSNVAIPDMGIQFSTGISFALTTGIQDSDTNAVAANEIVVNLDYL